MKYVGRDLPAWVRFRPKAPGKEAFGPPTAWEDRMRRMLLAQGQMLLAAVTKSPWLMEGRPNMNPVRLVDPLTKSGQWRKDGA